MEVVAVAVLRAELSVDARASSLASRARFDAPSDDDDGGAEDAVDDDDAILTLLDAPLLNCAQQLRSQFEVEKSHKASAAQAAPKCGALCGRACVKACISRAGVHR